MRFETRPLGRWTDPETAVRDGSGRFRADWNATLELLGYEADQLGASLVVIQIDVEEGDLRRDGALKTRAVRPEPRVIESFQQRSESVGVGLPRFACPGITDNVLTALPALLRHTSPPRTPIPPA